jgi:hypothetical protein
VFAIATRSLVFTCSPDRDVPELNAAPVIDEGAGEARPTIRSAVAAALGVDPSCGAAQGVNLIV